MSENCNHDCSSCEENCSDRKKESLILKQNELSDVKKVIGVVSGKGGVGKSLVTSMLAVALQKKGFKTAILDADVTGPSIPKSFGITSKAEGNNMGIMPIVTDGGTEIMSINLLLENDTDPVIWRGPVVSGTVKQFWTDVIWSEVDYMFVDMPPGTSDVALTIFQSLPLDGIVIVTSPQDLVSMIVKKAVNMAEMMDISILGLVENYSYFTCPKCNEKIEIFGKSDIENVAKNMNLEVLGRLPINPEFAKLCDAGLVENIDTSYLDKAIEKICDLK